MPAILALEGYHAPFTWVANGDLTLYPVSVPGALNAGATAAVGAAAGAGFFDGFRETTIGMLMDGGYQPVVHATLTIRQRVAGAAGNTVVELYRLRAGVWTLLCSASLGFAAGNGGSAGVNVASVALGTINAGDVLCCLLVGVQTGAPNPEDLTATVTFG